MPILTFNKTAKGSSHDVSGKPCQDFSLSEGTAEARILIVCDGHGGDTYVRSDVGAKLAATIARDKIKDFVSSVPQELFAGKKGALTALPKKNPLIDKNGNKVEFSTLSESQQEIVMQAKSYLENQEAIAEQNTVFQKLFEAIYSTWLEEIQKDAAFNPFTDAENAALGNNGIEKAYGSTLMAYVQTPLYWFAFHIGDGKMLACNSKIEWCEPVPWDCACFLNVTTSLCDSRPLSEFRFAFDGTGYFPTAVFLGSDGIDDSFLTPDRLRHFYTQTLEIFASEEDKDDVVAQLGEYLPKLSKKASHDDMSIAGLINLERLADGLKLKKISDEGILLKEEKVRRNKEVSDLKEKYAQLQIEINKLELELKKQTDAYHSEWKTLMEKLFPKKKCITDLTAKLRELIEQMHELIPLIEKKIADMEEWEPQSKVRFEEILAEREALIQKIEQEDRKALLVVAEQKESGLTQEEPTEAELEKTAEEPVDHEDNISEEEREQSMDEEAQRQAEEIF